MRFFLEYAESSWESWNIQHLEGDSFESQSTDEIPSIFSKSWDEVGGG